jgi:hypothetical protein
MNNSIMIAVVIELPQSLRSSRGLDLGLGHKHSPALG